MLLVAFGEDAQADLRSAGGPGAGAFLLPPRKEEHLMPDALFRASIRLARSTDGTTGDVAQLPRIIESPGDRPGAHVPGGTGSAPTVSWAPRACRKGAARKTVARHTKSNQN